jgi:hypothetical protein
MRDKNGLRQISDSAFEAHFCGITEEGRITGKCPPLGTSTITPRSRKYGDILARYDRVRHLVK